MQVAVGFVKPSSRSFGVVLASASGIVTNDLLLENQPNGRLRNFLSASFDSEDVCADAFRMGGGSLVVRTRAGVPPMRVRVGLKDGKVVLRFEGSKANTRVEVRMLIEEPAWT